MTPPTTRFLYIDALRGLAVLGVIAIHASQKIVRKGGLLPDAVRTLAEAGQFGVQLFFLVSAITLFVSQDARRAEDRPLLSFFVRRFFRIAPMYYLAAVAYLVWRHVHPALGAPPTTVVYDLLNLACIACFANAWHPGLISSIPPGGWSVAIEMHFYLLVPWLHARINTLTRAVVLATAAVAFAVVVHAVAINPIVLRGLNASVLIDHPRWDGWFLYFWLPNQFPVFCFGIVAYFFVRPGVPARGIGTASTLLALAIAGMVAVPFVVPASWPVHLTESVFLACFAVALAWHPLALFVNPLTRALGKVSFSMYLFHFCVLDLLEDLRVFALRDLVPAWPTFQLIGLYIVAVTVTALLASVTYHWIEMPGIEWGRRLLHRGNASRERSSRTGGVSPMS